MLNVVVYEYEKNCIRQIGFIAAETFNTLKCTPISYKLVDMSECYLQELFDLFDNKEYEEVAYKLQAELESDDSFRIFS